MKKTFILLYISLILLSCQKEENNKIYEYQVLPSENAFKPFSCFGEKRTITVTIIQKTLIDDILDHFDNHIFYDLETGQYVTLTITNNKLCIQPI